jgi:hypothetical protein
MSDQPGPGDPIPEQLMPLVKETEKKLLNITELGSLLRQRDGAFRLASLLPQRINASDVATVTDSQVGWEWVGHYYMYQNRLHEALSIFNSLYQHMLGGQQAGQRIHKGMPLLWIGDCHLGLGRPVHAKRYCMLTLCEDAIRDQGKIDFQGGPYFRLVWRMGLSHDHVERYYAVCEQYRRKHPDEARFPERVLSELDQEWMIEVPSTQEAGIYCCSGAYARYLLSKIGTDSGKSLERMAHYLVGLIPGCRAYLRKQTHSTDHDVVGVIEGAGLDFRSDLGRYFVCECKDFSKEPADFTVVAKFCRVLDSTKAKFGILFSTNGVSGQGRRTDAELEILKVFQDRGIVIVVVDRTELERVAKGENLVSILREKYEQVRLGLR